MVKNVTNDGTKTVVNISIEGVESGGVIGPTGAQGPAGPPGSSVNGIQSIFTASVTNIAGGVATYIGQYGCSTTEFQSAYPMTRNCVASKLFVRLQNPASGGTVQVTVKKNFADTALVCTVADGATTAEDLVNTVAFNATDYWSVKAISTGGDMVCNCSFEIV